MELSDFGKRFASRPGITLLMDDLGQAMAGRDDMLMLGGGNPAQIPEAQAIWRRRIEEILADGDACELMLVNYDTPRGCPRFINELASFLSRHFGWDVGPENIAVTNGAQVAFYCLLNMFAGQSKNGSCRKILFPLMPEYIGYADQSIDPDTFVCVQPRIDMLDKHTFKYHIDFDNLKITEDIAAICVSRPTNPTGNVLTDDEIERLSTLAKEHDIPLIIDNAYGIPFPGIVFTDAKPVWNQNIILTLSLSKLGLPGTRTGIVVAPKDVIDTLAAMNSVLSLANGNVGQAIIEPLLKNDEILRISNEVIRPFYLQKSHQAINWIHESFDDDISYYVHKSEGAMFLWLWFKDLPISTMELYERLKKHNVLVVPGSYFFFGRNSECSHQNECIRINYSQPDDTVRRGIQIIAEEVQRASLQS
ncbi:MAG: valine--pyruvate transaminase [Kiritimatiellae bacterium]|nr:valine--pyruvate transaminase [Kiritimatiellia bacterium]